MAIRSSLIPTTQVWDTSQVQNAEGVDKPTKELLIRMYQNLANMANAINYKDTGLYGTDELLTGKLYFPKPGLTSESTKTPNMRSVIRKVFNWINTNGGLNTLPNAATDFIVHGIAFDVNTILINIYGAATDPAAIKLIPLPFVADAGSNIALWADATNIYINTGATDRRNYTIAYIVIEYLKF